MEVTPIPVSGDHFFDVFPGDDTGGGVVELIALAKRAQILFLFALFLGVEPGLFEFMGSDGAFHAMGDELDALLDFANFFGNAGLTQLDAGAGFVDQVDGLVGRKRSGM